jgi:hypothetical protein
MKGERVPTEQVPGNLALLFKPQNEYMYHDISKPLLHGTCPALAREAWRELQAFLSAVESERGWNEAGTRDEEMRIRHADMQHMIWRE